MATATVSSGRHRVVELDVIRGTSVLVMIIVHTLAFFASAHVQTSGIGGLVMSVGKASAVFVFCLGVSASLAKPNLRRGLRRGGLLLLGGYALNVAKFAVPMLVLRNFPATLLSEVGLVPGTREALWSLLTLEDILHLAGVTTIAIALLRAAGVSARSFTGLAAVVVVASPLLWGVRPDHAVIGHVADVLWGDSPLVFFPAFPWMAFAFVGVALGDSLQSTPPERRPQLFDRWFVVGAALMALAYAVGQRFPSLWTGGDFYRSAPAASLCAIGFSLMTFRIGSGLTTLRAFRGAPQRFVAHLRARVTSIYCISWMVLCWSVGSLGYLAFANPFALLGLCGAVLAVSVVVDEAWFRVRHWERRQDVVAV